MELSRPLSCRRSPCRSRRPSESELLQLRREGDLDLDLERLRDDLRSLSLDLDRRLRSLDRELDLDLDRRRLERDGDLDLDRVLEREGGGERERGRVLDGRSECGGGGLARLGGWVGAGAAPARTKPDRKEEAAVGLEGKEVASEEEEKPSPCLKRRAPSPLRLSSS